MCEKCEKIDREIEGHRVVMAQSNDPVLIQRTTMIIRALIAEKLNLHTERNT